MGNTSVFTYILYTFTSLLMLSAGCSNSGKSFEEIDRLQYTTSFFGENVLVFDDTMDSDSVRMMLNALHEQQKYNEFGSERYALLFKPGT